MEALFENETISVIFAIVVLASSLFLGYKITQVITSARAEPYTGRNVKNI